jgi:non-homologous end joining protein Ku
MAIRTNIELKIGPVATVVSIDSGFESRVSDTTVCVGQPGHEAHEASPARRPQTCETCGPITDTSVLEKARKVGEKFHVIPLEVAATLSKEHAEPFKNPEFIPSPREQVDAATVPGEKLYYLNVVGMSANYANIRSMIRARPDLAFVARFTPKAAASVFTLEVRGDVLVMVERVMLQGVRALPAVEAEPDTWEALVTQAVDAMVVDFDASLYDDAHQVALAEAFAASTQTAVIASAKDGATASEPAPEMGAELLRLIEASKKTTPARQAAQKKVAARKVAAPKRGLKVAV